MIKAVVGANWGDEGKGKITDVLANDSDIVIRFQGGANAGHTIVKVTDYQKPEETGLPAANVLIYKLDNGETVVVRPSGTEPKIKIYYTTLGKNLEEAEAEKEKLAEALKPIMA